MPIRVVIVVVVVHCCSRASRSLVAALSALLAVPMMATSQAGVSAWVDLKTSICVLAQGKGWRLTDEDETSTLAETMGEETWACMREVA